MTTQTGYVMTLANSIIGVSLLAMPYCFKQCGVILAVFLLMISNVVTRLACHFLVKSGVMCRRKNFEYVGYHAFGVTGKLIVELGVIGFLMGTNVAYFVVMGDLAPAILSKLLDIDNNDSLRTTVLLVTGIFVILPLSMLRNIESLAAISTGTMMFYLLLVLKVLSESSSHLASADWVGKVNMWRPEGILQCFPIFAMALSCQTQVFEILEVLPNPSLEKMNAVVKAAVTLCTSLYVSVGFFGYVAYARQQFAGNVLLSFSSSTTSDLFQLGFVASIALSFPIVVFPCRASLNSLLYNKGAQYHELTTATSYIPDARFKTLTACIVSAGLITGLFIPNIEFVLGIVGSTIGVAICIIFPSAAFINISGKNTTERLIAKCVLIFGVVVMILGMYGNLSVAIDSELHHQPGDGSPLVHSSLPPVVLQPKLLPPSPPPPPHIPDTELKLERMEPKVVAVSPKASVDVIETRREPPVPMEPIAVAVSEPAPKVQEMPSPVRDKSESIAEENVKNVEVPSVVVEIKEPGEAAGKKKQETVHDDAIAKEEHQLKEDDKLEKKEEERQGEELLQKLKEHKEEQKQLLKEQQNILDEIKIREGEPVPPKSANIIEPNKFSENIEKIQEVIDDLKERKQVLDKTKGEKIAEDKKKNAEKKSQPKAIDDVDAVKDGSQPQPAVPVMLKAIVSPSLNASMAPQKQAPAVPDKPSPEAVGRDILSVATTTLPLEREKREVVPDSTCEKSDKTQNIQKNSESKNLIKDVNVLSAPVERMKKEEEILTKQKHISGVLPAREETRRRRR